MTATDSLLGEVGVEPTPDRVSNGFCSPTPDPTTTYISHAWFTVPPIQKVNTPARVDLWIENHGPTMPTVVLDLQSDPQEWAVNLHGSNLGSSVRSATGATYYTYGSLGCGHTLQITLSVTPKRAGHYGFAASFYAGLNGGQPSGSLIAAPGDVTVNVLP